MNTKQTKAAIIKSIHDKLGKDRKDIHMIIYGFFDEMKDGLGKARQRNSVASEHSRSSNAKEKVRTPKTGETVSVDKHGVAVVKAGKELKDELWEVRSWYGIPIR